jgi:hypothetical protein
MRLPGRAAQPVAFIEPGASWSFLQPGSAGRDLDNAAVLIRFDDANEVRWQANLAGRLDEAPDAGW